MADKNILETDYPAVTVSLLTNASDGMNSTRDAGVTGAC